MITALHLRRFATTLYQSDYALSPNQPLILLDDTTVYGVCHFAESCGVRPRMSEKEARSRCPEAHVAAAQVERDAETLLCILEVLAQHTESIEPLLRPQAPIFLVDTPVRRQTDIITLAQQMGSEVRAVSHQTPAIAVAPTVFTAKTVSTLLRPGYIRYIPPEQTVDTLRHTPITILPLPPATLERMQKLGITTVGAFADLPSKTIASQFGKEGKEAWDLIHGRDATKVRPRFSTPHIHVYHAFDEPIRYQEPLLNTLNRLSEEIANALVHQRVAAVGLWLQITTDDGGRQERRATPPAPVRTRDEISVIAHKLFHQVRLHTGVTEIHLTSNPLISLAESATQTTFFDRLSSFSAFQQWLPRFTERHGRNTIYRYQWRAERVNVPEEEQFDLIAV
jgi:nucleotidyltransferase/DNA polymerase involved in DNA repair